jgi:hypothetical protein
MATSTNDQPQALDDLYALELDEALFAEIPGTTLAWAPVNDHTDAFAVRDVSNVDAGTLRLPAAAIHKLSLAIAAAKPSEWTAPA